MLRTEKVSIGGREIIVTELSSLRKIRLMSKTDNNGNIPLSEGIEMCLKSEDIDFLDTISDKTAAEKLIEAVNKVNKWGKYAESDTDPLSNSSETPSTGAP